MKKAKMMLAAIAVFAVVGGVYASKAKRQDTSIFVRGASGTYCTVTVTGLTLSRPLGAPIAGNTYATTLGTVCASKVNYYVGN